MLAVTFYSFRGGVGRTTLATNVAAMLADAGLRVLLVDFDLEAPGLSYLDELRLPGSANMPRGVAGYLNDCWTARAAQSIDRYMYDLPLPKSNADGRLAILPAGDVLGDGFASDAHALREADFFRKATHGEESRDGMALFHDLRQQWERSFDYVLIDARTGFTDVGGVSTRILPDAVLVVLTLARQARAGTRRVLDQIRGESLYGISVRTAVVVSHVPDGFPIETAPELQSLAKALDTPPDSLLQIPHTPSLLLREHPFFTREVAADDELANRYRRVAQLVRSWNEWDVDHHVREVTEAAIREGDAAAAEQLLGRLMQQSGPLPQVRRIRAVNHLAVLLLQLPGTLDQRARRSDIAIEALRGEIGPSAAYPQEHAMTVHSLANALRDLPGEKSIRFSNLGAAISYYRQALEIIREESYPSWHRSMSESLKSAEQELIALARPRG